MGRESLFYRIILGLLGLVFLNACELTQEELQAIDNSFITHPAPFVPPPEPVSGSLCTTDVHYQPDSTIIRKIDILFVTDTSGSLESERPEIVDGIDSFVAQLPPEIDYQAAVMLAHGSKSSQSGRLYQRDTEPLVLNSKYMSVDEIRNYLKFKMSRVISDGESDGGEEGLFSLSRAFESKHLEDMQDYNFLREDAALAIVFIADENDICARYPDGVTPVYDPDRAEGPAFVRDCEFVTPESVLAQIREHQQDRPLLISGIIYNQQSQFPSGGENEIGYGYLEMINLANGVSIDLAGGHFNEGLAQIGILATKKLNLITEFELSKSNVDSNSIKIFVDRSPVPFNYVQQLNEVHLIGEAGTEHSEVLIAFCPAAGGGSDEEGGGTSSGGNSGSGTGSGSDEGPILVPGSDEL